MDKSANSVKYEWEKLSSKKLTKTFLKTSPRNTVQCSFTHWLNNSSVISLKNLVFLELYISDVADYIEVRSFCVLLMEAWYFHFLIVSEWTNVFIVTWLSYAEEELTYSLALAPDWFIGWQNVSRQAVRLCLHSYIDKAQSYSLN